MGISYLESVKLSGSSFDPKNTFESGQVFRWYPVGSSKRDWVGTVSNLVIRASSDNAKVIAQDRARSPRLQSSEFLQNFFSVGDDLQRIMSSFPRDDFLSTACSEFKGLRILTQEPWECLVSFLCSIDSNISTIQRRIESLAERFGRKIYRDSLRTYYSFPEPEALAKASARELISCKTGFRWKYIKFVAEQVASGRLDFDSLTKLSYIDSRNKLVSKISGLTFGVGPKVADCTLLFSLGKTEAFPIDVWVRRCLEKEYSTIFGLEGTKSYERLSAIARSYFGKYAGYAQQYLYMKTRTDAIRNRARA